MKKLLILLLVFTLAVTLLVGCGPNVEPDVPGDGGSTDVGGEKTPTRLPTPTVTISDDGLATWNEIPGAVSYIVEVNGSGRYQVGTSYQLKNGDSIGVAAVGDGETHTNSLFSRTQIYGTQVDNEPKKCAYCGTSLDVGNHEKLGCGHFACDGKDHTKLDCGHFACDSGEHESCEYCDGYLCTGDHTECGKPVIEYCEYCGLPLGEGNHELLDCKHHACEGGNHESCEYCGGYLCTGDHTECGKPQIVYCDNCGKDISIGNHEKLGCEHFACDGGEHGKLPCNHYECDEGEHESCEYCDGYLCTGDHTECGKPQIVYCDNCGKDISIGNHEKLNCNHYVCDGKDHTKLNCGHFACDSGNHNKLDCNHYVCDGRDHIELDCGHFGCDSGDHNKLTCGHFTCEGGEHGECEYCGEYLCTGNHSECGKPQIIYCDNCGKDVSVGDHTKLNCGHFACDSGEHNKLDCNHYACDGKDHTELDCGHFACDSGNHNKLDCNHYACDGKDHAELDCGHFACDSGEHNKLNCGHYSCDSGEHNKLTCGHFACDSGEHNKLNCGHFACDSGEHNKLNCGHYSCDGKDHAKLNCGHFVCDGNTHSPCEICGELLCIGNHGDGVCVKISTFPEIYEGENESIFTTEGIVCAIGAYELMITDNKGNYIHIGFADVHPYTVGTCIRITGYKFGFGNISYDLVPIEIEIVDSDRELDFILPTSVDADYFNNSVIDGYKMGEYISFTGSLDRDTDCFIVDGIYVGVVWTGIEVFYNTKYTVTAYVYYLDSIEGYWVIATKFKAVTNEPDPDPEICPACGGYLMIGDHYLQDCGHYICLGAHELLDCGHYSCDDGNHESCSWCGKYICHGGSHSRCYACGGATCDGNYHDICSICGWYLCRGDHSLLECGHRACEGGEHYTCGVCGEYLCWGGDHYKLYCGHFVCDGGIHKICPSCHEPTCNGPDHELCEYCSDHVCTGTHKVCPACGKSTCNKPDHPICGDCGNYKCICDCEPEENNNKFVTEFLYSASYQEFEDVVYCDKGDESRPLIRLISYTYEAYYNFMVSFEPLDDNTFIIEAYVEGYLEDGTFLHLTIYTFTGIQTLMDDGRYVVEFVTFTNMEGEDIMKYHGTYFPKTRIAIISVDRVSMSFEIPTMLAFILGEKFEVPEIYAPCYYCGETIVPGEVNLHVNTCTHCGKQFCEGGVEAHYFYNDTTYNPALGPYAEHFPVSEEDIRTNLLTRIEIEINGGVIKPGTVRDEEEEE